MFDLGGLHHRWPPAFVPFTSDNNADFFPSITYLTLHDPGFVGGEEPWDSSSLDLERRYRLGSEVTSLSLTRSSSTDKSDPLDNLNLSFRLTSSMK